MNQKLILWIAALFLVAACQKQTKVEFLIEGGRVYIGDRSEGFVGDVAVTGGEIVFAGKDSRHLDPQQRIPAHGLIVSPGFIDPHTHSLEDLRSADRAKRRNDNYRFQGVTTVFNGNDGFGHPDIAKLETELSKPGLGLNTALYVGHGNIRSMVMGSENRAPTTAELGQMKALLRSGMEAGAIGLSTGLFYAPGSFSKTDEVIELAKLAGTYGGVYDSHIRDESTYNIGLEAAIDEVLEIGQKADIPVHIGHIKALGVDVWGMSEKLVAKIEKARKAGIRVTADQYPWPASGTRISNALLPRWVKAGTSEDYLSRLDDPALLEQIRKEMAENLRRRGGAGAVLITQNKNGWQGLTLEQLASKTGVSPVEMALEIARQGDARIASFNMSEEDIERFMTQDWVMTSSDGSTGHPRKYASFPRKYETYVKDRNLMDLATYIYRSAGLAADTFGLCNRGYLKPGFAADIVVFDPKTFSQHADFHQPEILSKGVEYLWVNGSLTVNQGQSQDVLPGKVLRRCAKRQ